MDYRLRTASLISGTASNFLYSLFKKIFCRFNSFHAFQLSIKICVFEHIFAKIISILKNKPYFSDILKAKIPNLTTKINIKK